MLLWAPNKPYDTKSKTFFAIIPLPVNVGWVWMEFVTYSWTWDPTCSMWIKNSTARLCKEYRYTPWKYPSLK